MDLPSLATSELCQPCLGLRFGHDRQNLAYKRYAGFRWWSHSTFTPAALITLAHFSVSWATSLPNSAGPIGIGSPPSSLRRAFSLGSASTAFTAALSLSMISGRVPFGTAMPYQTPASYPGTGSPMGGTPGSPSTRSGAVDPDAPTLPVL